MADIQKFRASGSISGRATRKLNNMVTVLNGVSKMQGDGFISVSHTPGGGLAVRLNIDAVIARMPHLIPLASSGGGDVFRVLIELDGGDAGDASSPCTFTYTVRDFETEDVLATGQTPYFNQRGSVGKMEPAGVDSNRPDDPGYGLAFFDGASLILAIVNERPRVNTGECD